MKIDMILILKYRNVPSLQDICCAEVAKIYNSPEKLFQLKISTDLKDYLLQKQDYCAQCRRIIFGKPQLKSSKVNLGNAFIFIQGPFVALTELYCHTCKIN